MSRHLKPAEIISILESSLDNFVIEPLKAAPPSTAKAIYYKLKLVRPGGAAVPIKILIENEMTLTYGVVNPANGNDKRNQYVQQNGGKQELNVNFNLIDEQLVRMFDLLQAGLYHALRKSWDSGNAMLPSKRIGTRKVHTLIDRFKPDYENGVGIIETPAEGSQRFDNPRITFRCRPNKRPMDHKVVDWRGTPESVIMDALAPKLQRVGQADKVVGYHVAKIDGQDICYDNAYQFLNYGSKWRLTIVSLDSVCYSPTFISAPMVITQALVRKGSGVPDEGINWESYYAPDVDAETPINVSAAMPAVSSATNAADDLFGDMQ